MAVMKEGRNFFDTFELAGTGDILVNLAWTKKLISRGCIMAYNFVE